MVVQGVALEVGDWLRCTSDLWEGQVVELDEDAHLITLAMHDGDTVRLVGPDEVLFNWWDPRLSAASSP